MLCVSKDKILYGTMRQGRVRAHAAGPAKISSSHARDPSQTTLSAT
jgi:hypothetical protein